MLVRNWLNKQTERAAVLMHSSRRRVLAMAMVHIVLLFSVTVGWNVARDENGGGSFINVETGKKYHVDSVGGGSWLGETGERHHVIYISLIQNDVLHRVSSLLPFKDRIVLELSIDNRIQPGVLDFSQTETSDGYRYSALLVLHEIIDIDWPRMVCGHKEWKDPLPYGDSGQLFLKDYSVAYRYKLEHVHGEAEIHFQDCQIDAWGIDGEDITLVGTFYR